MPRGDTGDATLLRCSFDTISDDRDVEAHDHAEESSTISFVETQEVDEMNAETIHHDTLNDIKPTQVTSEKEAHEEGVSQVHPTTFFSPRTIIIGSSEPS